MATSIYGTGNHPSGRVEVALDWWESWVDTASNTSHIEVELWIRRNDGYTTTGQSNMEIGIAGQWSGVLGGTISFGSSWVKVGQFGLTVEHDSDGSKSVELKAYGGMPNVGWTASNCSGWASLTTIPRASSPSAPSWVYAGDSFTIKSNAASSAFGHNCLVRLGSREQWTSGNFGASVNTTIPLSWCDQMPDAEVRSADIAVDTFAGNAGGSAYIGTRWASTRVWVPESVVPTLSGITVSDTSAAAALGVWVAGVSAARVSLGSSAGVYGSTIRKTETYAGSSGSSGSSADYPLGIAGTVVAGGRVTDSRGRSTSKEQTLTVLPYAVPRVTTLTAERVDTNGSPDAAGTQVKITHAGTASSLKSGSTEKNASTWTLQWREKGATTWTTAKTGTGLTWSDSIILPGEFSLASSYEVRLTVQDKLTTTLAGAGVGTGGFLAVFGKNAVGFGAVPETSQAGVVVGSDLWFRGARLASPSQPTVLGSGVHINTVVTPGWYLAATPPPGSPYPEPFTMVVEPTPGGVRRTVTTVSGRVYTSVYTTVWSAWVGDTDWFAAGVTGSGVTASEPFHIQVRAGSVYARARLSIGSTTAGVWKDVIVGIPVAYQPDSGPVLFTWSATDSGDGGIYPAEDPGVVQLRRQYGSGKYDVRLWGSWPLKRV